MTRIWDNIGDELTNAKRGMGAYLVDRSDDSITAYGETNQGGLLRVSAREQDGQVLIRLQSTEPRRDHEAAAPVGLSAQEIASKVLEMVEPIGTLVDVDSFEGEGPAWHEQIETFTDKVDATFDGPTQPQLSKVDEPGPSAPSTGGNGPTVGR